MDTGTLHEFAPFSAELGAAEVLAAGPEEVRLRLGRRLSGRRPGAPGTAVRSGAAELKPTPLKSRDDLTGEPTAHAVGLDEDERGLHGQNRPPSLLTLARATRRLPAGQRVVQAGQVRRDRGRAERAPVGVSSKAKVSITWGTGPRGNRMPIRFGGSKVTVSTVTAVKPDPTTVRRGQHHLPPADSDVRERDGGVAGRPWPPLARIP